MFKLTFACTVLATCLIVAKSAPTEPEGLPVGVQDLPVGVQELLSNRQRIEENLNGIDQRVTSIRSILNYFDNLTAARIISAIRSRNYVRANEIIRSTHVTVSDWSFIVREIYERRESGFLDLIEFGSTLEVGNTKVVYYLTLLNLLEDNRHLDLVSTVLAVRGQTLDALNLDVLVKYNPFLSFLTFEQRLVQELRVVLRDTLLRNELLTNPVLNGIQWDVLTGIQLESLRETDVLLLQRVLNRTVVDVIRRLNITNLVEQIETIDVESESNKILRLHLYGALIYAIHEAYPNHPEQFRLAYSYRAFVTNVQFNIGNEYLRRYIDILNTQYLHGCVRNIINADADNIFMIRNVHYDEYIYVTLAGYYPPPQNYWKTTPAEISRSEYQPIFAWIPKIVDAQMKFLIDYENGLFWIRSGYYTDRYLDSSRSSHLHASIPKSRELNLAVRLIPSGSDNESCHIQNVVSGNLVVAGPIEESEDADRRVIYTNGQSLTRDSTSLWQITNYKAT